MNELYNSFVNHVASNTGIDRPAAEKVVTWLISEGVLDAPVVADNYSEGTVANDA